MEVYLRDKKTNNIWLIALAHIIAPLAIFIAMIVMLSVICLMPIIIPLDFVLKLFTNEKIWLIEYQ